MKRHDFRTKSCGHTALMRGEIQTFSRRYYQIAGITLQVEAALPITDATFHPKFKLFEVDGPGEDTINIRHYFSIPDLNGLNIGEKVYRKAPWAIYRKGLSWIYVGISRDKFGAIIRSWLSIWCRLCYLWRRLRQNKELVKHTRLSLARERNIYLLAVFNHDHTRARIYNDGEAFFREGGLHSLTLFPTDQILIARVLADRGGCYIHAGGVVLEGKGLLFVGHSDAGKSTMITMMKDKAEILCDDRMIVRRWPEGFMIHGTWSHGDVPDVSAGSAPLKAILFLEQAQENRLITIDKKQEIIRRLLACLVRPFVTADWWDRMLTLVDTMAHEVPCYSLRFDKSGGVVDLLTHL